MSGTTFAILTVIILVAGFFMCGLILQIRQMEAKHAWEARNPDIKLKRLRKEREIARLENGIEAEKMWAQLRPAKIEASAAGVLKQRDQRLLDWMLTRQALDQVNGGPRVGDTNPLATAMAAVSEEIENRKADGGDTRELEELMRRLQSNG